MYLEFKYPHTCMIWDSERLQNFEDGEISGELQEKNFDTSDIDTY